MRKLARENVCVSKELTGAHILYSAKRSLVNIFDLKTQLTFTKIIGSPWIQVFRAKMSNPTLLGLKRAHWFVKG